MALTYSLSDNENVVGKRVSSLEKGKSLYGVVQAELISSIGFVRQDHDVTKRWVATASWIADPE